MRSLINPSNQQFNTCKKIIRSFWILSLTILWLGVDAQVFLQIEKVNKVKPIKLIEGSEIHFKLKEYPDTWRIAPLEQILPESNNLVLDGNIYRLDDFAVISVPKKPFVHTMGRQLQIFGLTWTVIGGLAYLGDEFRPNFEEYTIGAAVLVVGTILRMLPRRKKYNLEKNARLRIIDLRMFVPDDY